METTKTINIVIKGKANKDLTDTADKVAELHSQGKFIPNKIGKVFLKFCKNTIILM